MKAQGSGERDDYFVTREMTDRLIAAAPDTEWKLIILLCRYGGLRCPSEVLRLRWIDVDFDIEGDGKNGRFIVHSPKTEHIPGKEERTVPLFPKLRPLLKQVFDDLEGGEGTEYVITRYNHETNMNLRTQFCRIIRKAGLTPWPKLFHSMRKSRETELIHAYGMELACTWIGNSPAVARKHYFQVRDEDMQRAAFSPTGALPKAGEKAPDLNPDPQIGADEHIPTDTLEEEPLCAAMSECKSLCDKGMGPEGFEPPTKGL